jgi:hypothetical protein
VISVVDRAVGEGGDFERIGTGGHETLGNGGDLFDADGDADRLSCIAAEDAAVGGDIGEAPADADADVLLAGDRGVCGIDAHPARVGNEGFAPGVRLELGPRVAVEISGYVPGGMPTLRRSAMPRCAKSDNAAALIEHLRQGGRCGSRPSRTEGVP